MYVFEFILRMSILRVLFTQLSVCASSASGVFTYFRFENARESLSGNADLKLIAFQVSSCASRSMFVCVISRASCHERHVYVRIPDPNAFFFHVKNVVLAFALTPVVSLSALAKIPGVFL